MEIEQVLLNMGLEDKEPEVYKTLVSLSGVQPASIIAKHAGLNRTTTYKTLTKLADRGLATKTLRHGIICFYAEDPEIALEKLMEKKKAAFDELNKGFLGVLPMIKNLQKQELVSPKVKFYEGVDGVKRAYEDTLIEGEDIYAFLATTNLHDELSDYLENSYLPRRIENDIYAYVAMPETKENKTYKSLDKKSNRETRFITQDIVPAEIEMNIYGNKIAFFSHKSGEQFGIVLESQAISKAAKAMWDICWTVAEKHN